MTNEEFVERIRGTELEDYIDPAKGCVSRLDDMRRIYELCEEMGASFVRFVAMTWRAQDDRCGAPRDRSDARGYGVPMSAYDREVYPLSRGSSR